jgi:hypothetical protein
MDLERSLRPLYYPSPFCLVFYKRLLSARQYVHKYDHRPYSESNSPSLIPSWSRRPQLGPSVRDVRLRAGEWSLGFPVLFAPWGRNTEVRKSSRAGKERRFPAFMVTAVLPTQSWSESLLMPVVSVLYIAGGVRMRCSSPSVSNLDELSFIPSKHICFSVLASYTP